VAEALAPAARPLPELDYRPVSDEQARLDYCHVTSIGFHLPFPIARAIYHEMVHADRARVFSSREHDASRMTAVLRSLGVLVTSRYHASVLSLAAAVPQLAVGHDLRLRTLYSELGIEDRYFLTPDQPDVFDRMNDAM
jgi:polysaccharide pyruvyl transferase WcaK-like protein